MGQGSKIGYLSSENCIVAWKRQPRVDQVVADLPIISRASTTIKNQNIEAVGALLQRLWPFFTHPRGPLVYDLLTHGSTLSRGHRTRFRFEVEVCLAGQILADEFVEAAGWGPSRAEQDLLSKADCIREGPVYLRQLHGVL